MGNLFHIGEVAALLFLAYTLGWGVGYFGRRAASQRMPVGPAIAAERLAAARGEAPAKETVMVAAASAAVTSVAPTVTESFLPSAAPPQPAAPPPAPVIAPVEMPAPARPIAAPTAPMPMAPVEVPVPSPAVAEPSPSVMPPAARPVVPPAAMSEPTIVAERPAPYASPVPVASPPALTPADDSDEFILLRPSTPSQPAFNAASAIEAAPATQPGVAWSGDINGHVAPAHTDLQPGQPAERPRPAARPVSANTPPATAPMPITAVFTAQPAPSVQPLSAPEPPVAAEAAPVPAPPEPVALDAPPVVLTGRQPAPSVVDPDALFSEMMREEPVAAVPEPDARDELVAPPLSEIIARQAPHLAAMEPEAPPPPPPAEEPSEEDAAMRAIEGGWSRRRVRAMTDRPEMIDVSAAVAAAQTAVQQVLAQTEIETTPHEHQDPSAGKPVGLPRPHDGRRDNLREIAGLSPLDESTLNNLGIYHFEQIAAWTAAEVLWLEDHVFARGRIGRESWQSQALELSRRRPSPSRSARG